MADGIALGPEGRAARPHRRSRLAALGGWLAAAGCVLALPFALVASNVRGIALDRGFYLAEFDRYEIGAAVGLNPQELGTVADTFIAYFRGPPGQLDVQIGRGGALRPLFSEREVAHMEDVQTLVHLIFRLGAFAALYILAYVVGGLMLMRRAFVRQAARVALAGASLTVGVFLLLGAAALVDFSELFVQFHLLSFSNDLWQLDPRRDNLIRLFPLPFWQDAALRVVVLTLLPALALGALAALTLRLDRTRARPTA